MNNKKAAANAGDAAEQSGQSLRQRAETALRDEDATRGQSLAQPSPEAMAQTLHDLRVHQIELALQNEELRRTMAELDTTRARYFDFYDMAPVGYCTVDAHGLIVQANLSTASLLGVHRNALLHQRFAQFVQAKDQDIYYRLCRNVLSSDEMQAVELQLRTSDDHTLWIYLQAIAATDASGAQKVRLVLSDISELRGRDELIRLQAQALDQIRDTVTITDLSGIVTYINQAGRERTDVVAAGMLGHHVSAYGDSLQADATQQEIVEATLNRGSWNGRIVNFADDGSALNYELRTSLVRDEAGTPIAMVGVSTDITQQLSFERELRQREAYQRAVLDNFPFEVWLKDLEGRYLAVNKVAASQHGAPPGCSLVGKRFSDIVDPALAAPALELEQDVIATGKARHTELLMTIKGEARWHESYMTPVVVDGQILGTVGYSRDITDKRQREEKIRIQALALDQIQDRVTITDVTGSVTYLNQAGRANREFPGNAELQGRHVSEYGESGHADAGHDEIIETTLTQGGWKGKVGHLRADGSEAIYDLRTTLVKDEAGKPIAMVGVGTDITRKLRLEQELRQNEQYLRALLDNFPFLVWLKDLEGHYLAVNRAFASAHGYSSTQALIGKHFDALVDPTSATQAWEQEQQIMSSGGSTQVEVLMPIKGRPRWFETYKAPIVVDGKITGTVGYSRDISERKQIELDLLAAKTEAVKANQAKSHFLAAASHDLRQPIFALSLFFDSLKKKVAPGNEELVAKTENCIACLSEMLNNLLDVSKLEAGVVKPEIADFSVNELQNSLIDMHVAQAHAKGLRLRWRECELMAHSDRLLLSRIIGNFLDNAIRHTRQGGVLLACRRHAGRYWLEVWDTGVGIPADKTTLIFDAFQRLEDASQVPGSGLGLTIAEKTATLLGLKIRMHSRPGRGSMFAIELPLGQQLRSVQSVSAQTAARQLRIALVEDDQRVLDALTLALEEEGHAVVAASSGKLLMAKLGVQAPDILISDYRLASGESGFDVIETSRVIFGNALPALLITGDTDPVLIRSMAERGITVLYKPLQFDTLQAAIQRTVPPASSATP